MNKILIHSMCHDLKRFIHVTYDFVFHVRKDVPHLEEFIAASSGNKKSAHRSDCLLILFISFELIQWDLTQTTPQYITTPTIWSWAIDDTFSHITTYHTALARTHWTSINCTLKPHIIVSWIIENSRTHISHSINNTVVHVVLQASWYWLTSV